MKEVLFQKHRSSKSNKSQRWTRCIEKKFSQKYIRFFCVLLLHPQPYTRKKTKQTIQEQSSREKNSRRVYLAVSTCLKFLAHLAVKQIYTLIHTPLQRSFLKQFCAAGMKRQTRTHQISPFCFQ